jgi:hypothetical protein
MANDAEFMFNATVDDELYDELVELVGQEIVHIGVWEDSMVDALESLNASATPTPSFDIDLYLEGGVYFELYGVSVYPDPSADAWSERAEVERKLSALAHSHATLGEVAVDEGDALVLVLFEADNPAAYLAIGGWLLEAWDELPV